MECEQKLGTYSESRQRKSNNNSKKITGYVLLSVSTILFLGALVLPSFVVFEFLRGILGVVLYPTLLLLLLVGIALVSARRFTMQAKNVVYLSLLAFFVIALFHTIFTSSLLKTLEPVSFADYGAYIKECSNASTSITVGGGLFAVLTYPFVVVLGIVGSYVLFALGAVILCALTIDYYINLANHNALYTSRATRQYGEQASAYKMSSDSIGANLSTLSGATDLVPNKVKDEEYTGYFNYEEKQNKSYDADDFNTLISTETSEPIEKVEDEEISPSKTAIDILYGKREFEGFETSKMVNDEKAMSSYDPNKFSNLNEYINYAPVPKEFTDEGRRRIQFDDNNTLDNDDNLDDSNDSLSDTDNSEVRKDWFNSGADSDLETDQEAEPSRGFGFGNFSAALSEDEDQVSSSNRMSDFDREYAREQQRENAKKYPSIGDFDSDSDEDETLSADTWGRRSGVRGKDLSPRKSPERRRFDGTPFGDTIGNNSSETLESRDRRGFDNFFAKPKEEAEQIKMDVPSKPRFYGGQEKDIKYIAPPTTLLDNRSDDVESYGGDYKQKSADLEKVLSSFKIDAKVCNVIRGPSVTQFELTMPFGVSVRKILGYDSDIAAALRAKSGIRIEAPIYGKNAVGVEIPNDKRSTVGLRELFESKEFQTTSAILPVAIGKNISGEVVVKSMAKMVHMLVAGSTGSGKSIFLHSLILSLMYKCSPRQLRFIMIDPKRVEFTNYSGMPHMMLPNAVTECDKAINALTWAVKEMDRRYRLFQVHSVQNIEGFNHSDAVKNNQEEFMPYIVFVIDELADLMMVGKRDVEEKIQRLAQLGRASGIHMVIATQRPSVDVITGTIKNNLPTRVAFSLGSAVDSKTILDEGGAEKLLGAGDMLLAAQDSLVTIRLQAGFMSMDEVKRIIQFIKDNNECYFDEDVAREILSDKKEEQQASSDSDTAGNNNDFDELMPQALKLCIETGGASINMVQRRFRVGYARAARIIDQMELAGFVSPGNGSKLRNVYITMEQFNEMFGDGNQ